MKVGKLEFTPVSLAELGSTVVFAILTIVLGISAYKDFRLWVNFHDAREYYGADMLDKARVSLEKAISARPDYFYPREMLAKILASLPTTTELKKARGYYRKILKMNKKRIPALIGMGVIAVRRYDETADSKFLDEGEEWFKRALSIRSKCVEARIGLGHVALRRGRVKEAESLFQEALSLIGQDRKLVPTRDALIDLYIGLGYLASKQEKVGEAERYFRCAYHEDPSLRLPLVNIAYMQAKKFALCKVERSQLDPLDFEKTERLLNRLSYLLGRNPKRNAEFKDALYWLYIGVAIAYGRLAKDSVKVETYLQRAASRKEHHVEAKLWGAVLFDELAREETKMLNRRGLLNKVSRCLYADVVEKDVTDPKLRARINNWKGVLAYEDHWNQAKEMFERATRDDPDNYIPWRNLAIGYYEKERNTSVGVEKFQKYAQRSLKINPDQPDLRALLKRLLGED
jgi:Tfp pilus assembly protein PilF